jgi:hypothetical protein
MWVRRKDERFDLVALAPAQGTHVEEILLPCDAELLIKLGTISLGGSRAGLYATRLAEADTDLRLVLCSRGTEGAVRIHGIVPSIAEPLYGKTRAALLAAAQIQRAAGRPAEAAQWSVLTRQLMMAKRSARQARSIRTTSGGLPTLGKRS